MEGECEDGLDLLVGDQELPTGTPGGKKDDLRKGKFVDGAKHEKGGESLNHIQNRSTQAKNILAIRFFSRDTYKRLESPSPSLSPMPSPSPAEAGSSNTDVRPTSKQDKRSSSPFEVKLSACVTKRMSLDAFGTPSPPHSDENISEATMEELLEEYDSDNSDIISNEDDNVHGEIEAVDVIEGMSAAFQHTSLSTIQESSSTRGNSSSMIGLAPTSAEGVPYSSTPATGMMTTGKTPYFTADSSFPSSLDESGLPVITSFPSIGRKHASAPPMGVTQRLLEAHVEHTRALRSEVDMSDEVRKVLEKELEEKEKGELYIQLIMGSIS